MTDASAGDAGRNSPSGPAPASDAEGPQTPKPLAAPAARKPRKAFLLVGVVVAVVVGIFLFTGLGTSQGSTGSGAPHAGGSVPSFTSQNVGPVGGSKVSVSSSGGSGAGGSGSGQPTVLLFFGNWCPSCHQELPPLAAA